MKRTFVNGGQQIEELQETQPIQLSPPHHSMARPGPPQQPSSRLSLETMINQLVEMPTEKFIMFIPCRVCGDRSTGVHYGAITCEGCKGFFSRNSKGNVLPKCSRHHSCSSQGLANRNKCRNCRYIRCLEVGMQIGKKSFGRKSRQVKMKMIKEAIQMHPDIVPKFKQVVAEEARKRQQVRRFEKSQKKDEEEENENVLQLTSRVAQLLCENVETPVNTQQSLQQMDCLLPHNSFLVTQQSDRTSETQEEFPPTRRVFDPMLSQANLPTLDQLSQSSGIREEFPSNERLFDPMLSQANSHTLQHQNGNNQPSSSDMISQTMQLREIPPRNQQSGRTSETQEEFPPTRRVFDPMLSQANLPTLDHQNGNNQPSSSDMISQTVQLREIPPRNQQSGRTSETQEEFPPTRRVFDPMLSQANLPTLDHQNENNQPSSRDMISQTMQLREIPPRNQQSGRTSETQEEFPPTRRVFDPMLSQANFPTLDHQNENNQPSSRDMISQTMQLREIPPRNQQSGRTSETQEEFPPTRRVFDPMLSQANFPTLDHQNENNQPSSRDMISQTMQLREIPPRNQQSGRTSETQEEFPPTRRVFDPMLSQANFPTLDHQNRYNQPSSRDMISQTMQLREIPPRNQQSGRTSETQEEFPPTRRVFDPMLSQANLPTLDHTQPSSCCYTHGQLTTTTEQLATNL